MDLKLSVAITAGKILRLVIKLGLKSGATAAPGLLALRLDPNLIRKLSQRFPQGSLVVSGTNGKTTTSRIIFDLLSTEFRIIHNRQGSNLLRGIASALINEASILGSIKSDLAVWESDEATLAQTLAETSPKTVLLLNLFRDQLDRYGEVDSVRDKWIKAVEKLPKTAKLILNADDPGIAILGKYFKGKTIYFGVNAEKINLPQVENVADVKFCLNCGSKLEYNVLYTAHLGSYQCPACGLSRPPLDSKAGKIIFGEDFSTYFEWEKGKKKTKLKYNLPGLYNVYNVLAAVTAAKELSIPEGVIQSKIASFTAVFGRFQATKIKDKKVFTFLIKNPAGANEVIRTISLYKNKKLLLILNDNIADGKDVSWIWDTNWEKLQNIKEIYFSGLRMWDIANRLKYTNFKLSKNNVSSDINYSIKKILTGMNNNDTLFILPTYTSLLKTQRVLSELGEVNWQNQ